MTITLDTAGFSTPTSLQPAAGLQGILSALAAQKALLTSIAIHALVAGILLYSHTTIAPVPEPLGEISMVFETASSPGPAATAPTKATGQSPSRTSDARAVTQPRSAPQAPAMAAPLDRAHLSARRQSSPIPDIAPLPLGIEGIRQAQRSTARPTPTSSLVAAAPDTLEPLTIRQPIRAASVPPARPVRPVQAAQTQTTAPAVAPTTSDSQRIETDNPSAQAVNSTTKATTKSAANASSRATGSGVGKTAATKPGFRQGTAGNPPPSYPRLARQRGQQGRVVLRVNVQASGKVADIAVHSSSGFRLLDRAALKTVRQWSFSPAMRDGKKVAGQVDVPVAFRLHD